VGGFLAGEAFVGGNGLTDAFGPLDEVDEVEFVEVVFDCF
jgi:hypothetical protein